MHSKHGLMRGSASIGIFVWITAFQSKLLMCKIPYEIEAISYERHICLGGNGVSLKYMGKFHNYLNTTKKYATNRVYFSWVYLM